MLSVHYEVGKVANNDYIHFTWLWRNKRSVKNTVYPVIDKVDYVYIIHFELIVEAWAFLLGNSLLFSLCCLSK